jgi:hypothetical protein
MTRSLTLLFSVLLASAAVGCEAGTAAVEVPEGAVQLATQDVSQEVAQYLYTGIRDRRRLFIDDAASWTALWAEVTAPYQPPPPLPAIDFNTESVIVAAMGQRHSGGYAIAIESVHEADGKVYVTVREQSPGSACVVTGALTAPVAAVRIPRRDATSVFVERTETHNC